MLTFLMVPCLFSSNYCRPLVSVRPTTAGHLSLFVQLLQAICLCSPNYCRPLVSVRPTTAGHFSLFVHLLQATVSPLRLSSM